MHHSDNSTIPIRSGAAGESSQEVAAQPKKRGGRGMPRFLTFAIYAAVLPLIGWGAWRCFAPAPQADLADVVAEMEGFEAAPAFSRVPEPDDGKSLDSANFGLPPALPDSVPLLTDRPAEMAVTEVRGNAASVWLTGTIEDSDSSIKKEPALRISGSPQDAASFR